MLAAGTHEPETSLKLKLPESDSLLESVLQNRDTKKFHLVRDTERERVVE